MSQIDTYKQNAVITQTPGRLIVMLYEGAIKFLKQAIEETEAGNIAAKGQCVGRATDIINELDTALDTEAGGEVAQNLRALYEFMRRHITQAHIKCDPQMFREVIKLLEDLNEGWKAVTD